MRSARFSFVSGSKTASILASVPAGNLAGICSSLMRLRPTRGIIEDIIFLVKAASVGDITYIDIYKISCILMISTTELQGTETMKQSIQADAMRRAWIIFRQTYNFPAIKFSDIGRKCFAWALRQAWVEAREAARVAALSTAAKADRIATLEGLIAYAGFVDSGPQWKATLRQHRDEIRQLQAA